jgi:hypothetical protein
MLLPLLLASMLASPPSASNVWYGPATAVFQVPAEGNPFDPVANDVRAVFTGPRGERETRLAYWAHGAWRAVLVAHEPGEYTARLIRNGRPVTAQPPVQVRIDSPISQDGFVRVGGPWGFRMDSGKVYWPLGHDLGWHSDGAPTIPETLRQMRTYGANWVRIWACMWDGKNPWWKAKGPYGLASLDETALDQWQDIVQTAQDNGVHIQLTLFHHGEFTTYNDTNWAGNPWNVKNGGFLSDPADFFTDPRAIALSKEYLRYMVARYGWSPGIMGWELFNEVEWVNAIKEKRYADVRRWHENMVAYIHSIDVYRHPVTSSSDQSLPIFDAVDYYQAHIYPARVQDGLLAVVPKTDKPYFIGETGGGYGGGRDAQLRVVRDAIWTSLFRHFSGSSQLWGWDDVRRNRLQPEWATAAKLINATRVLDEPNLKFLSPDVEAGTGGDLIIQPTGGWVGFTRLEFNIPGDAVAFAGQPTYFQGVSHPEMRSGPLLFHLDLPAAGNVTIRVTNLSKDGGNLVATVNGGPPISQTFSPGTDLGKSDFVVPVPAGQVDFKLDNTGPDWVGLGPITIPGLGKPVVALGIGNSRMALVRLERNYSGPTRPITISGLPLADGLYQAELTDLDWGEGTSGLATVRNGVIIAFPGTYSMARSANGVPITVNSADTMLYLRRGQ